MPDNPQLQEALRDASCRVWLYEDEHDFRPLLMLCGREANAGVYHYVCDHLGTPLELRDVRGGVVWSAMLRSYGQVHHADTAGINQPLRFQGQYHDAESGLYYNRHRYYDPGVGRYLSPDPVGLDGGLNLYAYVPNPLTWVDPLGLKCREIEQPEWTNHGYKHFPPKNKSWKDIIKSTNTGPAKYTHDVDIKTLEYDVFNTGMAVTNGKPWKVKDIGQVIGASEGKESQWMRVELSANTIHGHPISIDEFRRLTTQ
ncbi:MULTISPECIES: RHS repeat domain-containing protein [Enterobacter]|uniref:RHS repeat domain-containing protein n=1 Tax=Enterobacter TaxID=547 RepID=UPI0013584042|nr:MULTISPECIES: RHS repeat-associated core domain-containing protein [Enterobacter]